MRYCSNCGAEYRDEATSCVDCPTGELVSAAELHRRGRLGLTERDPRRFVRVTVAEDLLTAEELAQVLESSGIPVLTLDGRGGTVDVLTTGVVNDWWELRVPSRDVARAQALVTDTRQRLLATRAEAEEAAEEEALAAPEAPAP